MNALIIDSGDYTPKIHFEPEKGIFEISGKSRPEHVREFFDPVISWLDEYFADIVKNNPYNEEKPLTFNFLLVYFNSASSKMILDILEKLCKINTKGVPIKINWHYIEGDDDILETGQELSRTVNFPFNFIEV